MRRGAVAAPQPDNPGRVAACEAEHLEILVLGRDDESAGAGKLPDGVVVAGL